MTTTAEFVIPHRFCGPPGSANGGWTAGELASRLHTPAVPTTVSVRLLLPPPVDQVLRVATDQTLLVAVDQQERRIAEVKDEGADTLPPEAVDPVDLDTARAAGAGYPGHTFHPFPGCFVCGTGRAEGDGLRIFPGRVADTPAGRTRVATTWTPTAEFAEPTEADSATLPVTWSALDCIGGWAGDLNERLMVLGSITTHVVRPPRIGVEHILVGEGRGQEGRKVSTGVSLYDASAGTPTLVATAAHVWITVDPATFGPVG